MDKKLDRKTLLGAAGLLVAGSVAGGIVASNLTASAADSSTTATTAAAPAASTAPAPNPGGPAPVRSDETQLTGTNAAKARAAALAAVPGGTIIRLETDAGDAAYEAHMKKADGTLVTVKLDKDFKLVKVEDGMGQGDPRGGGPGGPDSNGSTGSTSSSDA
jgi:hypothetical protein